MGLSNPSARTVLTASAGAGKAVAIYVIEAIVLLMKIVLGLGLTALVVCIAIRTYVLLTQALGDLYTFSNIAGGIVYFIIAAIVFRLFIDAVGLAANCTFPFGDDYDDL